MSPAQEGTITDSPPTVVWLRQDLRLADNPALDHAAGLGSPVVVLYVLDDGTAGAWRLGAASRWWLHHSLTSLARHLEQRGGRLVLRRGRSEVEVPRVTRECGAGAVVWNRHAEPYWREAESAVGRAAASGLTCRSFPGDRMFEETSLGDRRFKVFSPFWRACLKAAAPAPPRRCPSRIPAPPSLAPGDRLEEWNLLPTKPDWAGGLRRAWSPGEAGAWDRLHTFLDDALEEYRRCREFPGISGTSRLSPHLQFGEISPRQVWHAVVAWRETRGGGADAEAEAFLRELAWRDFNIQLLDQFPAMAEAPMRPEFAVFPWRDCAADLAAWKAGQTGYPIVDAGMRELLDTGWMHNRARMIVGSFLVKDLLLPWTEGERWFRDTLVDAGLANNAGNWQWVAGCGADAAPYFRIFNPVLQGRRFDPAGAYVRRWVPELAGLCDRFIHAPWEASAGALEGAGVRLGETYPSRICDHSLARERALGAFRSLR